MNNKTNYGKIPYETILSAVNGDSNSLEKIISHFRGYIRSLCIRPVKDDYGNERWCVDEEMQARVEAKLRESIVNHFEPY